MSQSSGEPIFHEIQRPKSWWYIGLFVVIAGAAWAGFIQQVVRGKPIGDNPASDWGIWVLAIVFGVLFPLAVLSVKMETTFHADRVTIRWFPLANRSIPVSEIARFEARTYNPVREFAGWGIKIRPGNKMAYSIGGNEGVELTLADGRRVMIGSEKAQELAAALEERRGTP